MVLIVHGPCSQQSTRPGKVDLNGIRVGRNGCASVSEIRYGAEYQSASRNMHHAAPKDCHTGLGLKGARMVSQKALLVRSRQEAAIQTSSRKRYHAIAGSL